MNLLLRFLMTVGLMTAVGSFPVSAKEGSYEDRMKAALQMHVDASNFQEEQAAIDAYVEIANDHPGQWLPYYWASYINTQLANIYGRVSDTPKDVERIEFVHRAQKMLDLAAERVSERTDDITSDFHALQHFIYFFNSRGATDEAEKQQYAQKADRELKSALNKDPENPLVYVLAATNLMQGKDPEIRKALAARVLLKEARRTFSAAPERALTTHWNQEWIDLFWLNHATNTVIKLSAPDASR